MADSESDSESTSEVRAQAEALRDDQATRDERLPLSQHLAFALPALFGSAMGLLVAVYMGKFYVDVVLLPAGLYAVAIAAGRALDAVTDPMMGFISDHTRSRWGRRKPWILTGILGNAVIFYLMLTPGRTLSVAGAMTWFIACYLSSFIFQTMSNVPRQALGAELTLDAGERVKLFGLLSLCAGIGLVMAAPAPSVLTSAGITDAFTQMELQARFYVVGYVLANLWLLLKLRERSEFQGRGETPFVPGVRRALRNRPFVIMFFSHIVTAIPVAIPASLMPFYVQYVLEANEQWTAILISTYLLSGLLALPLWMWLARRYGKLRIWLVNGFIGATGGALMFAAGPGDTTYVWIVECYVGMQALVWPVLGGAMHADVIDYDELQTGKRREAQFSALWSIIPKFSLIPGAAIPLAILGGVGYVPNEPHQTEVVVTTLSILFTLVPAGFNAIGIAIMWLYPMSEHNHALVREGIRQHARGLPARDPITLRTLAPPSGREDEETSWFLDTFSARELRAFAGRGVSPLGSALGWTVACSALCGGATWLAVSSVPDFSRDPGAMPTVYIVAAGLSVAGAIFHGLRVLGARRLDPSEAMRAAAERHQRSL